MFDQKSLYNEYCLPLLDWEQLKFIFPKIYRISSLCFRKHSFMWWWREGWEVGVQSPFPNIK